MRTQAPHRRASMALCPVRRPFTTALRVHLSRSKRGLSGQQAPSLTPIRKRRDLKLLTKKIQISELIYRRTWTISALWMRPVRVLVSLWNLTTNSWSISSELRRNNSNRCTKQACLLEKAKSVIMPRLSQSSKITSKTSNSTKLIHTGVKKLSIDPMFLRNFIHSPTSQTIWNHRSFRKNHFRRPEIRHNQAKNNYLWKRAWQMSIVRKKIWSIRAS